MRLADSDLLPYEFTDFADTLKRYVTEVQSLLKNKQEEIRERNREIEEGVFTATSDPKKTFVPPPNEDVPPYLNFAPLENGLAAVTRAADHYQKVLMKAEADGGAAMARGPLAAVNEKLIQTERALTTPEGLPGRPWYRHEVYAPGFYTGYGVKTLPAVREAIEQKHYREAEQGINVVGKVFEEEARVIESAAAELEKLAR